MAAHEATHDLATGVANAVVLHLRLEDVASRWRRTSVLVAHLANADEIPDGALLAAIRDIARKLAVAARANDLVARTGAVEFAVLVQGDRFTAVDIAQRAVDLTDAPVVVDGVVVRLPEPIRLAIGIAEVAGDGMTALDAARGAARDAAVARLDVRHALDDVAVG